MRLYAFEGFRYTRKAGEAGELAAPPYDQINDAARDHFQARSPHQFVHLTRPLPGPAGDPFRHAAELHRSWLRDGVIGRDVQPALYPYTIELAGGGRRLGVMALVGIEDASVIRPHEQTLDKPLAERLALLEATHADLEPALLLVEDEGALEALLAEDGTGRRPLVEHYDADGHRHLLYRVEDRERIARYRKLLEDRPAAIADGHHRYKVAQRYAGAHGSRPGTAAAAKLAVVTSMSSPALTIDPIHRALRQPIDPTRAASLRQGGG
nr:DUF1015 domain-containing protein [Acidobacteriota bacterium]